MAFWDDAKKKLAQAIQPRQQQEQGFSSNRADGGFSGYVPKKRKLDEQNQDLYRTGPADYARMMPEGVDPGMMQQFQPVGGQTGAMPPQQAMPQQAMPPQGMPPQQGMSPQQPFGRPGYQPPMGMPPQMGAQVPPRPQAQFQGTGYQPQQRGFTARQTVQQPQPEFQQPHAQPQPAQPQSVPQTYAFPGGDSYVVDGNAYKMVLRVAQITGVPSCFRVIEFMYNNEAVIVNAEQVTDLVEADRCMDLIFGAACAMKQRLMRVSGKQIYVITPPQVYVAPFDSLRRAGMADIERRWPGAMQSMGQNQQPPVNNVQPMQPMGNQMAYQQPREDFAGGVGRRAARNGMHANGYTDYGGFGTRGR
ncbi:MAG: cell division protein SepF [Clostridiales bacterium]|nr:cell division protein SepF [Clostridiales bacterium]